MRIRTRALLTCLTLLTSQYGLAAQEPKPRVDAYGDPLPDGAIARLGTLRFVHLGGISSVAVSADGKLVASGVREGDTISYNEKTAKEFGLAKGERVTLATIRLWEAESGKRIREINTPDAPVSAMSFDETGRFLYAGCGKYMCCWEISTGKQVWQQEAIKDGEFDNDSRFETGAPAKRIILAKDKLISIHQGALHCSVIFKNGGRSYFRHPQTVVRYFESKTGKPMPLPKELESSIKAVEKIPTVIHEVAFTPDGRLAAVAVGKEAEDLDKEHYTGRKFKYAEQRLEIVGLDKGKTIHSVSDIKDTILALNFGTDGKLLARADEREVVLLDTSNGKQRILTKLKRSPWSGSQLEFIDKDHLAGQFGYGIEVWDLDSGKSVESHKVAKQYFSSARSGSKGVIFSQFAVRPVDLDSGDPLPAFPGHRLPPAIRYAVHSKNTLVSRDFQMVCFWDSARLSAVSRLAYVDWYARPMRQLANSEVLRCEMDKSACVERGTYMKVSKGIELRDIETDKTLRRLQDFKGRAFWGTFSAAGNLVAIMNMNNAESTDFFDVDSGKLISQLPRPRDESRRRIDVISPQGTYFATNSEVHRIELFDVKSAKPLRKLGPEVDKKERRGRVTGIGFSADEKIAYEVVDGKPTYESSSVRLWDVESGKVIQDFVVATSDTTYYTRISNFALSNDRRFVALTQAKGNPIEIWEVASGTKRGEFAGHEGRVADLAFSPDDRQLASSSEDTTILVWDMNRPLQPGKFADRLNADELTAQWRTLFDKDAKKADLAIWSLVKASADSLPFLKKHFVPAARPDAKHVQKLLGMLDSSDFRVRSKAEAELEAWGNLVLNDLEKASKEKNALEKQRRIDALLAKARNDVLPFGTPERIAQWRALEVLERIGNTDAIQLVRELANGAEGTQLTIAARNVLARLERAR